MAAPSLCSRARKPSSTRSFPAGGRSASGSTPESIHASVIRPGCSLGSWIERVGSPFKLPSGGGARYNEGEGSEMSLTLDLPAQTERKLLELAEQNGQDLAGYA